MCKQTQTQELYKKFEELFPERKKLIFTDYKNLGLICFDGNSTLFFVSSMLMSEDFTVVFAKVSEIYITPGLPCGSHISELLVNESGSKIALIGQKMVFIVYMPEDFWSSYSIIALENISSLNEEYFAECKLLHMSIFTGKYPPTVLKAVWPGSTRDKFAPKEEYLGILFSDNTVRLYKSNSNMETSAILFDYNNLLSESTNAFSTGSSDKKLGIGLGVANNIVSFDFGPRFTNNENDDIIETLFAMDTNGEIYFSTYCGDLTCNTTAGPIRIDSTMRATKFLCAACDLVYIDAEYNVNPEVFVLATSSSEGLVSHVVIQPMADILSKSPEKMGMFIYDFLDIPSQETTFKLKRDHSDAASYFISTCCSIYKVNINRWLTKLFTAALNTSGNENSNLTEASIINQLFLSTKPHGAKVLHKNEGALEGLDNFPSLASLYWPQSATTDKTGDSNYGIELVVVLIPPSNFMASIARRKSEASLSEEQCSVLTKHRVDSRSLKKPCSTFIEIKERLKSEKHLPQINLNELEYEEQLKFLQEATQVLSENQKIRETTIELSIRRAKELLSGYISIEKCRTDLNERITQNFKQLTGYKTQIRTLKKNLYVLDERIKNASIKAQMSLPVLSDAEKEGFSVLQNIQKRLKLIKAEASSMVDETQDYRNEIFSETKPFQASGSAFAFVNTKNAEDIDQLKKGVDFLLKEIDEH